MSEPYRLGLDLGANSIGWCLIDLDEKGNAAGLRGSGVRIFSSSELAGRDPKTRTSLAVGRREARSARRRRDRYLRRRLRLLETLVEAGLMPADPAERKAIATLDPYEVRARALDEKVPLFHLGRAIFHLNQRRGFKSNRKTDAGEGDDTGKIRSGVERLKEAMAESGVRTLGEFLFQRQQRGVWVRARPAKLNGEDGKVAEGYEIYPDRGMVFDEFMALWSAQARHYPEAMTDRWRDEIARILFFQRPLKPVKGGRCPFETAEETLPKAHPISQRLRIYQELNNLAIEMPGAPARFLDRAERDRLVEKLLSQKELKFDAVRKLLGLPPDAQFNLERGERDKLKGDETAAALSNKKAWGPEWRLLPLSDQCAIVERLDTAEDEGALVAWLRDRRGLDEDRAIAVSRTRLPAGHGRVGPTAGAKILAALEAEVISYSAAAEKAGYHHSDFRTGEIFDRLPYYGVILDRHIAFGSGEPDDSDEVRLGRIANPTVHIGLNQLRQLVNRIIAAHGHPDEIIVEVGRDLRQNDKQRKADLTFQKENRERNDRYRKVFDEIGISDTGENRAKMRLWEELNRKDPNDRRCPFCGGQISIHQLFSPEVEIEHLLPFSRSLDDSAANKTVSHRACNRDKGNRAPYDAFGHTDEWPAILERIRALPGHKRARFAEGAMSEFEKKGGFLSRHLNDMRYLSRVAREYLTGVCDPNRVWVSPGRMTAMLRGKWGLNQILSDHNLKNRVDHRHHAIDAAVIGVTDRSMLNRISFAAARAEDQDLDRLVDDMPEPWEGFRDDVARAMDGIVVSHRPDHGANGALHNDTALGLADWDADKGQWLVVTRKPLSAFVKAKDIAKIRDPLIRADLEAATEGLTGKPFEMAVAEYGAQTGVRRLRVCEPMTADALVVVRDGDGKPYKAYKGDSNHCIEVWRLPGGKWTGRLVTTFEANNGAASGNGARPHPAAKRLMRLHKDDLIAIGEGGDRQIMRVVKFSKGQIFFAGHTEAGNLKARDADKDDPFKYFIKSPGALGKVGARQVRVDEAGRLYDPGPLE